jgi:hypothetical protein
MTFNVRDVIAGALFVALGGWFAVASLNLELGTAFRMGPGYFPLILAGLLMLLGVLTVVRAIRDRPAAVGSIPWRGLLLVLPAPILFGVTVQGLGLVPALVLVVILVSFASRSMRVLTAVCLTAALVAFSVGVFSYGLGLPMRRFGPWLGF